MGRVRIRCERPSRSALALARAIGARRLHRGTQSRFRPRAGDTIINWGSTAPYEANGSEVWNQPLYVQSCVDKIAFFQMMEEADVPTPEWTTSRDTCLDWLEAGDVVMARTLTRASQGAGLIAQHSPEEFVSAPLYTKYFKGHDEYRVHVAFGEVIDVQHKRRRQDYEETVSNEIRSHANGWVFCREGVEVPESCAEAARACVDASGLRFGAVDIKHQRRSGRCAVLECNTAPGLEGTTLQTYSGAIRRALGDPGHRVEARSGSVQYAGRSTARRPASAVDQSRAQPSPGMGTTRTRPIRSARPTAGRYT